MEPPSLEAIAKKCKSQEARLINFQQAIETAGKIVTYCGLVPANKKPKQFCSCQGEILEITVDRRQKTVYLCSRAGEYL